MKKTPCIILPFVCHTPAFDMAIVGQIFRESRAEMSFFVSQNIAGYHPFILKARPLISL